MFLFPPFAAPQAAAKFTNISSNLRTAVSYNHIFYLKLWVAAYVNENRANETKKKNNGEKSVQNTWLDSHLPVKFK